MSAQKCSDRVWYKFGWRKCLRNSDVERDGLPFCKLHDPEAVKAKREAREKRWDAENKAGEEKSALQFAAVASYRLHCGEKARELAEADLLGEAVSLLRRILNGDENETEETIRALLDKLPKEKV